MYSHFSFVGFGLFCSLRSDKLVKHRGVSSGSFLTCGGVPDERLRSVDGH